MSSNFEQKIPIYLRYRYIIDFAVALLLFVIALPVMLIVAAFISRDGGPVLFRQVRLGTYGKEFEILKFRSMVENSDNFINDKGQVIGDRITPVGKLLRKTSIDELPQLINILRGEMGIIGPRPILPKMLIYMTNFEKMRFNARPGITGLAQINGRNNVKWSKRFAMDVDYTKTANLGNDLMILMNTVKVVLSSADISYDRNSEEVDDITNRDKL